jgi:predicted AAA+ superfamily ATPase
VFLNLFHDAGQLTEIRYWRTRNKQEIDFIVKQDNALRAFESKVRSGRQTNFRVWLGAYPDTECKTVVLRDADLEKGELFGWQKLI